jgi:hypothetical protein
VAAVAGVLLDHVDEDLAQLRPRTVGMTPHLARRLRGKADRAGRADQEVSGDDQGAGIVSGRRDAELGEGGCTSAGQGEEPFVGEPDRR